MSTFAPVYRPTKYQESFITKQRKAESKKRKRTEISSDDNAGENERHSSSSPGPKSNSRTKTTAFQHPVDKKDPYHVAGHSREEKVPPFPYPHAAVKVSRPAKKSIEEELAALNPPLYVPTKAVEDKSNSLRRRHLDNLTTILHRCMLKGDWQRAHRAWAILIRTEIAGRGIDIRRNGRWGIGAELLMRGRGSSKRSVSPGSDDGDQAAQQPVSSDEGFTLARQYYERLILQYPHTASSQHRFNATVVYPAFFNIWIYEVQDRAKRARADLDTEDDAERVQEINANLSKQAQAISQRMEELMLSPPYDTMPDLIQLKDMIGLWIADLCADVKDLGGVEDGGSHMSVNMEDPTGLDDVMAAVERSDVSE